MRDLFSRFARASAQAIGSAPVFSLYLLGLLIWLVLGPLTHYSNTWQLWANTITSLVTTAICLLIQNSVNHETRSIQLKLDELVHTQGGARDDFMRLEGMKDEDLDKLSAQIERVRSQESTRP